LLQRLLDGGVFRTQTKEKRADSTEDLQAFIAFLKTPQYRGHPYTDDWLGCLEGQYQTAIKQLKPNLRVVRDIEDTEGTRVWDQPNNTWNTETAFKLGPPGSAKPWVFNEKKYKPANINNGSRLFNLPATQ
jgi:hypothetical protein